MNSVSSFTVEFLCDYRQFPLLRCCSPLTNGKSVNQFFVQVNLAYRNPQKEIISRVMLIDVTVA